jgi:hypothetical protein
MKTEMIVWNKNVNLIIGLARCIPNFLAGFSLFKY